MMRGPPTVWGQMLCGVPEALLLVVFPQKPVNGYLGAEDGEEEGEDAVAEIVVPCCVDDEGAGDGEG